MIKLCIYSLLVILMSSCGGDKNKDENFIDEIYGDDRNTRYDPINPNRFAGRIFVEKFTERNLLFTLEIQNSNVYFILTLNADRVSKTVKQNNNEVGKVICTSSTCDQFDIKILNKYLISFDNKQISISAKFNEFDSFEFISSGIQLSYEFSHKDFISTGKFIESLNSSRTDSLTQQNFSVYNISDMSPSSTSIKTLIPNKVGTQEAYFSQNIVKLDSLSDYVGNYTRLSDNEIIKFYLKVEDVY
jgi:hypothetical protein